MQVQSAIKLLGRPCVVVEGRRSVGDVGCAGMSLCFYRLAILGLYGRHAKFNNPRDYHLSIRTSKEFES
jgi:hypothetical protein